MEGSTGAADDRKAGGISINLLNTFFIVVTAIVFSFILLVSKNVADKFLAVREATDKFIVCQGSGKAIKEASSRKTELARLFVVNLDPKYALEYVGEIEEARRAEKALDELRGVCSEQDLALQRLSVALSQAASLTEMELYAIRLGYEATGGEMPEKIRSIPIREEDGRLPREEIRSLAVRSLFGEGYLAQKDRIERNCDLTVVALDGQIRGELGLGADELGDSLGTLRSLFIVLLVVNVLTFIALALLVMVPLRQFQNSIRNDRKLGVVGPQELKSLAKSYNEIYDVRERGPRGRPGKEEYDALTGILSRRTFDQICRTSAESRESVALVLFDMDNFRRINEAHGHSGGDTALVELARILTATFRNDDCIARIGGDEFAALLKDFKPDGVDKIVRKIGEVNAALSELDAKFGLESVSVSVGVAYSATGYTQQLHKNAEKALAAVKEAGRCGCRVYDEDME